ncbi:MAG: hypothetical protein RBR89_06955, partial [Candidatus Bipolaricaulis sp.]|nr:hypothetical protein [Candidatus Bipolaricaulis sp.]
MTFYKNRYRIESHRKTGWDYSDDGWYFLTWVTRNRNPIFGEIQNKTMVLNPLGKIVETEILKSAIIRRELIMNEYVIMPNHVHFLIGIHHNLDFNAVETHGRASENECDSNAVETHGRVSQNKTDFPNETHGRASQNKTDFPNETHGRVSLPETPIPIRLPRSVSS